jgi:pyruvate dehydrogenase E2 component (dihydrolipoamide acetyltransferase)
VSAPVEVRVPNIGDFKDVPIIDILVKPGDTVAAESPLVTLESEKASIDVPSPSAGVVQSVAVKVGDKVSEGSVLLALAASNGAATAEPPQTESPQAAASQAEPLPAASKPVASKPVASKEEEGSETVVEVRVPDIGDFKDVPVIDVLVKAGERVELETPLIVLESEKASMEVPSPQAGVVQSLAVKVGDKVSQGSAIATLTVAGPAAPPAAKAAPEQRSSAPAAPAPASKEPVAERAATPQSAAGEAAPAGEGGAHASPSIRRFARELGVALENVRGSGPRDRITREDIQSFVKGALSAPRAAPANAVAGLNLAPWPKVDFAQYGPIERIALPRIKRIAGPNLHRNWVMIPHVTNNDEADITELEAFRQSLNAEDPKAKVTILAFIIKASVAALRRFPDFNASLEGDELVLKRYYHIGFAADTPSGLVVPVLRDADKKGVLAIAAETRELAAKARDGKLTLGEMQGGTFTISSLGGIGGTSFSPIVNAPEVAILGVSRSATRPVWDGAQFVPRLLLPLSLSYDHRVIDGAAAARFNAYLGASLADLRRTLL